MRLASRIGDEAISLEGARRVLEGQLPGRDFFEAVGPGEFYWQALFFKLFGTNIAVSRGVLLITGSSSSADLLPLGTGQSQRVALCSDICRRGDYGVPRQQLSLGCRAFWALSLRFFYRMAAKIPHFYASILGRLRRRHNARHAAERSTLGRCVAVECLHRSEAALATSGRPLRGNLLCTFTRHAVFLYRTRRCG